MGTELPLARQEEDGLAELLARISGRISTKKSNSRNKRKKVSPALRRNKVEAVKDTSPKSKSSSKVKGATARAKPKGHRRNNKNRKQDRGNEGEDTPTGRSAKDLGVTFSGHYCDDTSTRLSPHYWIESGIVASGIMFQCRKCGKYLWLPAYQSDAVVLGNLMKQLGSNEGYCQYLNRASRRPAKIMLAKLQRLYKLSSGITDSLQFGKLADKILNEKVYDKEIVDGQELSEIIC